MTAPVRREVRRLRMDLGGTDAADAAAVDIDDGTVEIPFELWLRNPTPAAVTVLAVATSCSCAAAKPRSPVVAPGEAVCIDITMRVAKPGLAEAAVQVSTDDGRVARAVLSAVGRTRERLYVLTESVQVDSATGLLRVPLLCRSKAAGLPVPKWSLRASDGEHAVPAPFSGWVAALDDPCPTEGDDWLQHGVAYVTMPADIDRIRAVAVTVGDRLRVELPFQPLVAAARLRTLADGAQREGASP